MIEEHLGFETERMSPVVPVATALLIAMFALGLLYRLVGAVL